MSWLLGAGIGFMLGGPLGAVIGGALQHGVSRSAQSMPRQLGGTPSGTPKGEQIFITHLVTILAKIAMADGSISDHERKMIHSFFSKGLRYRGSELRFIDAMIVETQRVNPDLHQVCKAFDQFAGQEQRMLLLDLVYQVVMSDHVITKEEEEAIRQVVVGLGIGHDEHDRIKSRHALAKRHDHYATLGLESKASVSEIKKAYRQLASQYHPDKVSHLGTELIAFSEAKFKSINAAHSALRKERSF